MATTRPGMATDGLKRSRLRAQAETLLAVGRSCAGLGAVTQRDGPQGPLPALRQGASAAGNPTVFPTQNGLTETTLAERFEASRLRHLSPRGVVVRLYFSMN